MSWFKDVTNFIQKNLEDYANQFFRPDKTNRSGKSLFVNPCPFCNHKDCFSLTEGINAAHCFSCGESGTLIGIIEKLHGELDARQRLSEWSGYNYNFAAYEPKQAAAKEKYDRYQRIAKKAVEYYHQRLLKHPGYTIEGKQETPGKYQYETRKHTIQTLKKYQVGYSGDYLELRNQLLEEGYEEDEIKQATKDLIGLPEGYFVYPYFDAKGNLVRFNCKLFLRTCRGKKKPGGGFEYNCDEKTFRLEDWYKNTHENQTGHEMIPDNLSRGEKEGVFLYDRKAIKKGKKQSLLIVEGENDHFSSEEAWEKLDSTFTSNYNLVVASIGGNVKKGTFQSDFLRQFETVYEAFDNDEAGQRYREMLNEEMPDVSLKHLEIPNEWGDIDELLKGDPKALELFQEMFEDAETQTTKNYKLWRDEKNKHRWILKNRVVTMTYEIDEYRYKQNGFHGTLFIMVGETNTDKKIGDIDKLKVAGELNHFKLALAERLERFYHDTPWVNDQPKRSFQDLLDIFRFTKYRNEVTKQIAWYLFHSSNKEHESLVRDVHKSIRNETSVANIFKEVNGYENQDINPYDDFPRIQLSQSLFPTNGDGYMYFAKFVKDGEFPKRVPCLVSNKKEEIRLDLLKKKDAQCLLLINNKYELPQEVENNIVPTDILSLRHEYVDKWINDELDEKDIHPSTIIREIEAFIRSTYYTTDDTVKVLALWIYATYFYTLFKSGFPYMVFNGAKGTGKSTLDLIVQLLAFNPTYAINITEAALFRQVSNFGGTFILDELENMVDSAKVNESGLAAVIKGGYAETGHVFRYDNDLGSAQGFNAFGPKVISNINGVEDVIMDRCIKIDTIQAPESKLKNLEDPFKFKTERRSEVYSITARAAISALVQFEKVDDIFRRDTRVDTGNARLTQILRPLVTIARLVGGDYEEHLMSFYRTEIRAMKADVKLSTLEGKLEHILVHTSKEILHMTNDHWIIGKQHDFPKDVEYNKDDGSFSMDSLQLKVLAEEIDSTQNYSIKEVTAAMKNVLGKFDNKIETRVTMQDEDLRRRMNNQKYLRVWRYFFNVREFVSEQAEQIHKEESEKLF